MARYRRYTKTIVKAPKKHWNLSFLAGATDFLAPEQSTFAVWYSLATNSNDSMNPTPSVIKCKHGKIQGTLFLQSRDEVAGSMHSLVWNAYLLYVPQVVDVNSPSMGSTDYVAKYNYWTNVIRDHPEWVMGRRIISPKWQGGVPGEKAICNFVVTSKKLQRNLKSGDKILMIFTTTFVGTSPTNAPYEKVVLQGEIATCVN